MIFRIYLKEILLTVLFALAYSFIFHMSELWWLAFVCLVPFCFCLDGCSSKREALFFGYLAGVLSAALTYYWILHVTVTGYIVLTLYLGIFPALFALFAFENIQVFGRAGQRRFGWGFLKLPVLAALWVLVEYARAHAPVMRFPWALLAASQWKNTVFLQGADHIGSYGLSFVIALVNFGIFYLMRSAGYLFGKKIGIFAFIPQVLIASIIAAVPAAAGVMYGQQVIEKDAKEILRRQTAPRYRISLIQGNIPQEEKWDRRVQRMVYGKYEGLTLQAAMDEPDLLIWPETAFPGYWEYEPEMADEALDLARRTGAEMLMGVPTFLATKQGIKRMNSAMFISRHGMEISRHHKLYLVPFGEYLPCFKFLRRFFDDIGRFSHGRKMTLFEIPGVGTIKGEKPRFAVLICFEDVFPGLCRRFVQNGADMLVNITNDAWFKDSTGPYQHAQSSVLRAVENRVPVIRAANTGLSCFIDPLGRITDSVKEGSREIMVAGFKTSEVILQGGGSFYTQHGDIPVAIMLIIWILLHRPMIGRLEKAQERDYSE